MLFLGLALGQTSGMLTSDYFALSGYPHHRYLLTLKHEQTPESDFKCTKRGYSADNMSGWDPVNKRQLDCVLYTQGDLEADGSFKVFMGTTWMGRDILKDQPIAIPSSDIIEARLVK